MHHPVRRVLLSCLVLAALLRTASPTAQSSFDVLHVFGGGEGLVPLGALVKASDGNLYGTTQSPGTIYQITPAGAFSVVHRFSGADGAFPVAGMVVGGDGLLYGTTIFGGTSDQGTVYRFNHIQRTVTVMYSFGGFNAGDGANPYGRLFVAVGGDLYGTTFAGGTFNAGTVFRITRSGVYSVVHTFVETSTGANPFAGVIEGNDGRFYGTTRTGVIYRVSASGTYELLRKLDPTTEGATLHSQLVKGTDGNLLYGTAREGGPHGHGTVFRLTTTQPNPVQFSVLYAFTGGADGSSPDAGLTLGPDGNLYGTTVGPYTSDSGRVVYRITPSGQQTVLHTFAPQDTQPFAPLTIPGDGAIYGATRGGPSTSPVRAIVYRLSNVFPTPAAPFGSFDTPADAQTVAGEVPVTGWTLDDTMVNAVEIYRSPIGGEATEPNGLVRIGSATFVEGARPDVAALYPTYPFNTRAGWGYMLLSNMLPNGGNGTFTLTAIAVDSSGNQTTLGQKTITAANSSSARPFGTIDTPGQGAEVAGVINNFGWALTPQPSMIPTDGSTITVYVDGVAVGHPTYNLFRSDIATLFPGYANSNGAVGHFSLDTRTLTNGVHILSWVVIDNNGNSQGIGSRYITVNNP
jgi:uncharacterized repeat protein (TIGR03803 family)